MIEFSVIIPVYNREHTIKTCLDTIFNQSYPIQEIIIVDDRSTDKTVDVVSSINNSLINLIQLDKNIGAQAARNVGIQSAKYPWIALNDSDDEWLNDHLNQCAEIIESTQCNPYTFIYSTWIKHDHITNQKIQSNLSFLKCPPDKGYEKMLYHPGPMFQGMVTSKKAFEEIDYNDAGTPSHDEWDTSIRLSKICNTYQIEEPHFIYHVNQGDCISANTKRTVEGYKYVMEKHKDEIIKTGGQVYWKFHLEMLLRLMLKHKHTDEFISYYNQLINTKKDINFYKLGISYRYRVNLNLLDKLFKNALITKITLRLSYLLNLLVKPLLNKTML